MPALKIEKLLDARSGQLRLSNRMVAQEVTSADHFHHFWCLLATCPEDAVFILLSIHVIFYYASQLILCIRRDYSNHGTLSCELSQQLTFSYSFNRALHRIEVVEHQNRAWAWWFFVYALPLRSPNRFFLPAILCSDLTIQKALLRRTTKRGPQRSELSPLPFPYTEILATLTTTVILEGTFLCLSESWELRCNSLEPTGCRSAHKALQSNADKEAWTWLYFYLSFVFSETEPSRFSRPWTFEFLFVLIGYNSVVVPPDQISLT